MPLESGLTGKRALITGGSRGIGFAIAKALASEGANLAIVDRDLDPKSIEILKDFGISVQGICLDISSESAVIAMVRDGIEQLNGLEMFVNNAAVALHEPLTRITSEAFHKTLDTNLNSCVWACREVTRHMVSRRRGSILVVGSTVQFCPAYCETSYRISKMGLKALMETLAIEMAPFKIRVNMLTPGHYATRLTSALPQAVQKTVRSQIPMRRFGDPDEIGAAAVLLLSDRLGSYISGAELVVDGGLSLRPLPTKADSDILAMNDLP